MPRGRRRQPGEGVVDRTAHVGRTAPDMEQEHNIQPALFDLPPQEPVEIKIPEWWHSSKEENLPPQGKIKQTLHGSSLGFHIGTPGAALDRTAVNPYKGDDSRHMHPVYLSGERVKEVPPEHQTEDPDYWEDWSANTSEEATAAVASGENVHYWNEYESRGEESVRAPRRNIMSWSEHVLAHPEQHHYYERKAAHKGAELVYGLKNPVYSYIHRYFDDANQDEDYSIPQFKLGTKISGESSGFEGTNLVAPDVFVHEHEFGDPDGYSTVAESGVLSPHLVFPKQNKPKSRKNSAEQPRLPGM